MASPAPLIVIVPSSLIVATDSSFDSYITQETYTTKYNKLLQFQSRLNEILFIYATYGGVSFFEYFPYGFVIYFYNKDGQRFTNDVVLSPTFDNSEHVLLRAKMMWERVNGRI